MTDQVQSDTVTWHQIKSWWPLLLSLISLVFFLAGIYFKVNTIEKNQGEFISEIHAWQKTIESRLGKQAVNTNVLYVQVFGREAPSTN